MLINSHRLTIRPFNETDVDAVFALRSDPEIMRFIRAPQTEREETVSWIKRLSSLWETSGIGFGALIEKESDELIGWSGLWILKESQEIEVGYAIRQDRWGMGYATEAAKSVLKYGFEEVGLERIVALAFPQNTGSINVMKKLGMSHIGIGRFYDNDLVQYAITKKSFLQG